MIWILYILIFSVALVIWRLIKQIYRNYQCVDEETLRDYLYGKLRRDPNHHRQVTSHLGLCEKCQEKLFEIQKGKPLEDHLVDLEED